MASTFCTHATYIWDQVGIWTVGGPDSADSQTIWACRGCSARFLDSGGQITTLAFNHVFTKLPQSGVGVGASPAATAEPRTPSAQADQDDRTPTPSSPLVRQPRLFELYRHRDVSGKSGTGVVVEGTQWTDGTVSIRWRGPNPSFANWPDVESLLAVHGHEGATELVWLDPWPEPGAATCRVCGCTDDAACFGGCYWVAEDLCSSCGDGPEGSAEVDDNEPEDTADASESLPEEG